MPRRVMGCADFCLTRQRGEVQKLLTRKRVDCKSSSLAGRRLAKVVDQRECQFIKLWPSRRRDAKNPDLQEGLNKIPMLVDLMRAREPLVIFSVSNEQLTYYTP